MARKTKAQFDPEVFLATLDGGRSISPFGRRLSSNRGSPPMRCFISGTARSRSW
jgi:hypothetical protein